MAAKVDLTTVLDDESPQSEKDVVRIFEDALNSSSDPTTATTTIINSLREYFITSKSEYEADGMLWSLWMVMLAMIMIVPIDHPWQRVFVDVVEGLRRRGGPVTAAETLRGDKLLWEDLPNLKMYVFDKFADPSDLEDCDPEHIAAWKSLNSFVCRLLTPEFMQWTIIPYWMIPPGLETPPEDVVEFEIKLWVATEWLITGGPFMYREMTSTQPLYEEEKMTTAPGPLCKDLPGLSLERWAFWRSRLSELAKMKTFTKVSATGSSEQASFSDESYSRMAQAIAALDAAEKASEVDDKGAADTETAPADASGE